MIFACQKPNVLSKKPSKQFFLSTENCEKGLIVPYACGLRNVYRTYIKIMTATNVAKYGFNNLKNYMYLTHIIQICLYEYFWFQNNNVSFYNLVSKELVNKEPQG